ncbi:MAG: hypothetical protein AB7N76_29320 [Planctomycetota bacterium]
MRALVLSLCLLAGCASEEPRAQSPSRPQPQPSRAPVIDLTDTVRAPESVPERITLHPKHGEPPYEANGRELYEAAHRSGWRSFLADFAEGGPLDAPGPLPSQQYGLEADAEQDGVRACQARVRALVDEHGEPAVRQAARESLQTPR